MVENVKNEITRKNILREIKRAEALSCWTKMASEEKIDMFISKAGEKVLDWHCCLLKEKSKSITNLGSLERKSFGRIFNTK
jgi:flavoprotein